MSKVKEAAELLWQRFVNQDQMFVTQWVHDERSGYRKVIDGDEQCIPIKLTDLERHVKGDHTVGVYQLKDDKITWLCFDVDAKDRDAAKKQTILLAKLLNDKLSVGYYLVEDSGSKGFHVWLFFETAVSAELGFRFGRWVHSLVDKVEDVSIEVFPKQMSASGGYGNLVKVPLGINKKNGSRCLFVNAKFEPFEDQLEALRTIKPLKIKDEEKFIAHYNIPTVEVGEYEPGDRFLCMTNILQNGPKKGHRDIAFHKGSAFLRMNGLPMDYTIAALNEANDRSEAPVSPREIDQKVESTYKNKYFVHPCREVGLDVYCRAECGMFAKKAELRGVTVERLQREVGRV